MTILVRSRPGRSRSSRLAPRGQLSTGLDTREPDLPPREGPHFRRALTQRMDELSRDRRRNRTRAATTPMACSVGRLLGSVRRRFRARWPGRLAASTGLAAKVGAGSDVAGRGRDAARPAGACGRPARTATARAAVTKPTRTGHNATRREAARLVARSSASPSTSASGASAGLDAAGGLEFGELAGRVVAIRSLIAEVPTARGERESGHSSFLEPPPPGVALRAASRGPSSDAGRRAEK